MSFDPKQILQEIIATSVKPQLKALGYRKSALTWRKSVGELTHVVNVQLSRHNSPNSSRFTLNLGAYHPSIYTALHQVALQGKVLEYHCNPRVRLGTLIDGHDRWWPLTIDPSAPNLDQELDQQFRQFAVPWLEQFITLEAIYQYFEREQQYFHAAVAANILGFDNVAVLMTKALNHSPHANFTRFMRRWATAHEITL
ncbi:DUF4304 domain-containing protein [filamentous cyanobacterium LEGE 11480]|uniref:DUF4304 domain-containing protein n=1 Tax=Romeriopsis navalis LEGE 11480 TaxID=2777977 RepID=A0A928VPP4_9CYAN|nr:DUF4304 domain-containing protein [Romeriopsis navalis]MBE9030611.1 DUF4304 domain-containing protein [Romeriopsis navalis LEGE 11480]